jgi:hypothetical protein
MAGRTSGAKVPITNIPVAIMAPEFPALTTAWTSPRFIISKATFMEVSFFLSALLRDSFIAMT